MTSQMREGRGGGGARGGEGRGGALVDCTRKIVWFLQGRGGALVDCTRKIVWFLHESSRGQALGPLSPPTRRTAKIPSHE